QVVSNLHYRKFPIDDKLSAELLDNYIKHLDPLHLYFIEADVESFNQFKYTLDDDLLSGKADVGFVIYNKYQTRLEERINFTFDLLKTALSFETKDSFLYKREEVKFAKNIGELDKIWINKIKYELLALKTDGKDFKYCAESLKKRYTNLYKQLSKTKTVDVFSFYANALTEITDPHTNYMAPRQADDFNTTMSLSLEGIGATLQTDNEYTKITSLVKGGPAEKSKLVSVNDKIVAVGQGTDGEMVSVLDWRIDDVVGLIRGKKGTIVKLEILPGDVTIKKNKIIEITRDKIVLEDQASKSSIKTIKRKGKNFKIGTIDIPTFYLDFARASAGEADYKSTTRDVKRIIKEFKDSMVDAIVIDLRNNGGGSLQEAVELTGLFIKTGPVVQIKDAYGIVSSEKDKNDDIAWNGPLEVIVNRFSASASEIFAAAMQDYGRALVIGEQTYGKGTVQNVINLDQYMQYPDRKMGQVKITLAKFYRISGGSTQHRGVIPDIEFPSIFANKEYGEDASKYSLPYDSIMPESYAKNKTISENLTEIAKLHKTRMTDNVEYKYLLEDIDAVKKADMDEYITVNEEMYKKELAETEAKNKARKEAREAAKAKTKSNADLILDEAHELLIDQITLATPAKKK
ncbi:MAG: carboxy terminal-processing peptidase, partial [Bacteroidia bacterium]|nr:carboxy terminal-processing peptidase [Bacteroidia bacterium]